MRIFQSIFFKLGVILLGVSLISSVSLAQSSEQYEVIQAPLGSEPPIPVIIPPSKSRMVPTKIRAVLISANGCGKCKIMRRKLEDIPGIAGVNIVELEFSDKDEAMFYGLAYSMGVEEALKAKFNGKVKPGSLYIVNLASKRVTSEIKHDESRDDIAQRLKFAAGL